MPLVDVEAQRWGLDADVNRDPLRFGTRRLQVQLARLTNCNRKCKEV